MRDLMCQCDRLLPSSLPALQRMATHEAVVRNGLKLFFQFQIQETIVFYRRLTRPDFRSTARARRRRKPAVCRLRETVRSGIRACWSRVMRACDALEN